MGGAAEFALVIRADAGAATGTGHLMRCLALAQHWRTEGGDVTFISRCESNALRRRIESAGAGFVPLEESHPAASDLAATVATLERVAAARPAWLITDGYNLDAAYHGAVRARGHRVLVVDDTAHLERYDADVVVNPNINAERLTYVCGADTTLLLGRRYALLREEFTRHRPVRREFPGVARRVLVTMGGSDPGNFTLKVIRALREVGVEGLEARAVVGPANPHREALARAVEGSGCDIRLIPSAADDMAALMEWAEVAVSAAGGTCWELSLMGTPTVLVTIADNQVGIAEGMAEASAAVSLGCADGVAVGTIAENLRTLLLDPVLRRSLSGKALALVDGEGVRRVFSHLRGRGTAAGRGELNVRAARPEDARLLWEWANDPGVRSNSFNAGSIPWEQHLSWYGERLASPDTRFWLLEAAGRLVAQIRYDREEGGRSARIGFSVAREERGKGYGVEVIRRTCDVACAELGVEELVAFTFVHNEASYRAFLRAGFELRETRPVGGHLCYQLSWRSGGRAAGGSQ
jgi:UDP-2,4-diacetamido-2,4,6-trideoxy-beta-L-altropyranose hydrolase